VYLNLTNRCPTACVFCLKRLSRWSFEGKDLRLTATEPSAAEGLRAAETLLATGLFSELIFCGYGESTYRLAEMGKIGSEIARRYPKVKRRLNTIGLGSLIWGRNIAPDLKRCVDSVSVSLNTADPAQWRRLHVPRAAYAEAGFGAVLRFVEDCLKAGLDTTVTAVRMPGVDVAAVKVLARGLGARFRLRPYLPDTKRAGG
jgi:TatD DNase family protein